MYDTVTRFVDDARACQALAGHMNSLISHLNEILVVLRTDSMRNRVGETSSLGPFHNVPLSRRTLGKARIARRAALRALSQIDDPLVKRCTRIWLRVLGANMDLRSHVAGAIDVLDGTVTAAEIDRERNLAEAEVAMANYLDLLNQNAANNDVGIATSPEVQGEIDEMRDALDAKVQNPDDSAISGIFTSSFTEDERSFMGIQEPGDI